jgi:hypothetical protein
MAILLELLGEVFCVVAQPVFEWLVWACVGIWEAAVEVVRYRRLERELLERENERRQNPGNRAQEAGCRAPPDVTLQCADANSRQ